jgi:hypothetical protein
MSDRRALILMRFPFGIDPRSLVREPDGDAEKMGVIG